MATFEATAVSNSDTGLEVSARDFKWLVDEPPSLGGGDIGPNPVETSFTASAKGELDPTKFLGMNMDVRAGYSVIEIKIEVESEADQATLDEIIAIAETRCPVSDNLANATPLTITLLKKA